MAIEIVDLPIDGGSFHRFLQTFTSSHVGADSLEISHPRLFGKPWGGRTFLRSVCFCVSGQVKTFYISMHGFKGTSKGNHMAYGCFNHKGALKRQTWQQRIHGKSWTDCKRKNVALPSSKTNITMSHWWMIYWFRMVISIAMLVYQRVVAMKDPRFRMSANSSKIAQSRVLWKWGI